MSINDIAIARSVIHPPPTEAMVAALEDYERYKNLDTGGPLGQLIYVGQVPDPDPWNSLNNKGTLHVFCAEEPWFVVGCDIVHVLVFVVGQNRAALWATEMPGLQSNVAEAANDLLVELGLGKINDELVSRIDLAGPILRALPLKEIG